MQHATGRGSRTYFTSKSLARVREEFRNASDKEVRNKKAIQRLVTKFRDTRRGCVSSRRWCTSAVKLFCELFLTNKKLKQLVLFLYCCD